VGEFLHPHFFSPLLRLQKKYQTPFLTSFIVKWIADMKKFTLALVLALCGTRVYGQLPQDVAASTEPIEALNAPLNTTLNAELAELEAVMKDPQNIDTACQELGLPKEEVKSWFARHKVLTGTGSLLGVYATLLALSYCGKNVAWRKNGTISMLDTLPIDESNQRITKMLKLRSALSRLTFLQVPVDFAAEGVESVWDFVTDNKKPVLIAAGILLVAAAIAWDLYRDKDSVVLAGYNKLFDKKEVAPATSEVVAEETAKAEVTAATTEVVAPTVA
jgi:hypothetical protein